MERNQTGSDIDTDRIECANEKDQEKVEVKLDEEMEWPCGVCGKDVMEDGIECGRCKKWYHVDCTDVISPKNYTNKLYSCIVCSERGGGKTKTKKPKDNARGNGKVGRPKGRKRSNSIPTYITKEDYRKNMDRIANNIEIRLKNKRNK